MLWRAKVFRVESRSVNQVQIVDPRSASFDIANAKYTPIASAYAATPAPPSHSGLLSSGNPEVTVSRLTRFIASATKSEKVVKATSWREVKRSPHVVKP